MSDKPSTLFGALYVLANAHTRDDREAGFTVSHMADIGVRFGISQGDYIEAWKVVRQQLGMQVEPEPLRVDGAKVLRTVPAGTKISQFRGLLVVAEPTERPYILHADGRVEYLDWNAVDPVG